MNISNPYFSRSIHESHLNSCGRCISILQLFNSGIEALESKRGEWRISSTSLRELMSAQLVEAVVPVYSEFYRTYSTVPFSKKHSEEYLRYTPQDVERSTRIVFGKVQWLNFILEKIFLIIGCISYRKSLNLDEEKVTRNGFCFQIMIRCFLIHCIMPQTSLLFILAFIFSRSLMYDRQFEQYPHVISPTVPIDTPTMNGRKDLRYKLKCERNEFKKAIY